MVRTFAWKSAAFWSSASFRISVHTFMWYSASILLNSSSACDSALRRSLGSGE